MHFNSDLFDQSVNIRHRLAIRLYAEMPPAALLKKETGPELIKRTVAPGVRNGRTFFEATPTFVAVKTQRKRPNLLP
jgi:hypothetical protein